jgi:predicted amidohydrolase
MTTISQTAGQPASRKGPVGFFDLLALPERADPAGVVRGFVEDEPRGLHRYNAAAYYRAGQLVHVHRKLYLPTYSIFEERKHFSPGQSMRAFDVDDMTRMALLICNDAWQPQIPFIASQDGARLLVMPAASAQSLFPGRYDAPTYWHDLTRFYARMLELFVVFVNRVGREGSLEFWGGSLVVDPWGEIIAEASSREELLLVDVDLDRVRQRRFEVPLVKEARLGLLQREVDRLLHEGGDQ